MTIEKLNARTKLNRPFLSRFPYYETVAMIEKSETHIEFAQLKGVYRSSDGSRDVITLC